MQDRDWNYPDVLDEEPYVLVVTVQAEVRERQPAREGAS